MKTTAAALLMVVSVAAVPPRAGEDPGPPGDPASAGPAAEEEQQPAATEVALRFAWPAGLKATVTTTKARTRRAEETTTRISTIQYSMLVEADGENLRIRISDAAAGIEGDLAALPPQARAQLVAQAADLTPDYRVTKGGEFAGLHDLPTVRKKLETLLRGMLPGDADEGMVAQILSVVTSEAFLNAKAAEQWNALVGTWAGADFELGADYTLSSQEPLPVMPGEQILMHYVFSANRLLPCRRGGTERTCAELEMTSTADPEDAARVTQAMISKLALDSSLPGAAFTTLEIENVLLVVTEPNGLVPHSLTLTRTIRGTVRAEGKEQAIEQVDRTDTHYAYP